MKCLCHECRLCLSATNLFNDNKSRHHTDIEDSTMAISTKCDFNNAKNARFYGQIQGVPIKQTTCTVFVSISMTARTFQPLSCGYTENSNVIFCVILLIQHLSNLMPF